MRTSDYIFDRVLVLLVLLQIREQPLTRSQLIRPLIVIGAVVAVYLRQVPTSGNHVWLTEVLAAIGWASGITVQMRPGSNHQTLVQARWASAMFWVLGMGGRFAFLVWISYGGVAWLAQFSLHHHIASAAAWTVAVLAEAVAEVVAQTVVLVVRSRSVMPHRDFSAGPLQD